MSEILYDPKAMDRLFEELKTNGSKINGEIDALQTAAKNFHDNLGGEKAQQSFQHASDQMNTALEDTRQKLDALAQKVENAKNAALAADGRVGDGVGGRGDGAAPEPGARGDWA
ncbi:WXG100 family type VII secretion target, partial [Nocardia wallacei]|uniref:WXG100 family type VII secretion target n=1 Tax=Nocardia wallacei TaxID=480035 RepID=UPI002457B041